MLVKAATEIMHMVLLWFVLLWLYDDVIKWKLFPALQAFCAGNSPVTGEFPSQRPVTRSFDVFFDLRLEQTVE